MYFSMQLMSFHSDPPPNEMHRRQTGRPADDLQQTVHGRPTTYTKTPITGGHGGSQVVEEMDEPKRGERCERWRWFSKTTRMLGSLQSRIA